MPRRPGEAVLQQAKKKAMKEYNRMRPSAHKIYFTSAWRNLREYFLSKNPLCIECAKAGYVTEAQVVDHIKPVSEGGEMLDINNLQPLCAACHNKKHGDRTQKYTYQIS